MKTHLLAGLTITTSAPADRLDHVRAEAERVLLDVFHRENVSLRWMVDVPVPDTRPTSPRADDARSHGDADAYGGRVPDQTAGPSTPASRSHTRDRIGPFRDGAVSEVADVRQVSGYVGVSEEARRIAREAFRLGQGFRPGRADDA